MSDTPDVCTPLEACAEAKAAAQTCTQSVNHSSAPSEAFQCPKPQSTALPSPPDAATRRVLTATQDLASSTVAIPTIKSESHDSAASTVSCSSEPTHDVATAGSDGPAHLQATQSADPVAIWRTDDTAHSSPSACTQSRVAVERWDSLDETHLMTKLLVSDQACTHANLPRCVYEYCTWRVGSCALARLMVFLT
jgi:hypothetical protein